MHGVTPSCCPLMLDQVADRSPLTPLPQNPPPPTTATTSPPAHMKCIPLAKHIQCTLHGHPCSAKFPTPPPPGLPYPPSVLPHAHLRVYPTCTAHTAQTVHGTHLSSCAPSHPIHSLHSPVHPPIQCQLSDHRPLPPLSTLRSTTHPPDRESNLPSTSSANCMATHASATRVIVAAH